ncbi:MAG: hypothetical protein NDI66_09175 [Pseudomonas sp.]|nr:hypothetical protein [Pseudomonas sp.]
MNSLSRNTRLVAFALVASLGAPLAFAQTAPTATPPAEQASPVAQDAAAQPAQAAAPAKKSWADVDADKDGKLTRAEADSVPALAQVFDQADGDADGALTAEEYKAFVGKQQGAAAGETK